MNLLATGRKLEDLAEEQRIQQQASPEDVQRIAQRYFAPERFLQCIVD